MSDNIAEPANWAPPHRRRPDADGTAHFCVNRSHSFVWNGSQDDLIAFAWEGYGQTITAMIEPPYNLIDASTPAKMLDQFLQVCRDWLGDRGRTDTYEDEFCAPHIAYFSQDTSFIWCGPDDPILVCPGGYGEQAASEIASTDQMLNATTPRGVCEAMKEACDGR